MTLRHRQRSKKSLGVGALLEGRGVISACQLLWLVIWHVLISRRARSIPGKGRFQGRSHSCRMQQRSQRSWLQSFISELYVSTYYARKGCHTSRLFHVFPSSSLLTCIHTLLKHHNKPFLIWVLYLALQRCFLCAVLHQGRRNSSETWYITSSVHAFRSSGENPCHIQRLGVKDFIPILSSCGIIFKSKMWTYILIYIATFNSNFFIVDARVLSKWGNVWRGQQWTLDSRNPKETQCWTSPHSFQE